MARDEVVALLKKAATDDVFRLALSTDLEGTVADHKLDLTGREMEALRTVDWANVFNSAAAGAEWIHIWKTSLASKPLDRQRLRGRFVAADEG